MIRPSDIAAHMRAKGLVRVHGVIEYSALRAPPSALPAHYVLPEDETNAAPETTGVQDEFVEERFQIVTVVAAAAARSDRVSNELVDELDKAKRTIIGWTPPGGCRPIRFLRGRLLTVEGGVVAYARTYRTFSRERTIP